MYREVTLHSYYFLYHKRNAGICCLRNNFRYLAYLDRGYFWALIQLPPAIIYKNI